MILLSFVDSYEQIYIVIGLIEDNTGEIVSKALEVQCFDFGFSDELVMLLFDMNVKLYHKISKGRSNNRLKL